MRTSATWTACATSGALARDAAQLGRAATAPCLVRRCGVPPHCAQPVGPRAHVVRARGAEVRGAGAAHVCSLHSPLTAHAHAYAAAHTRAHAAQALQPGAHLVHPPPGHRVRAGRAGGAVMSLPLIPHTLPRAGALHLIRPAAQRRLPCLAPAAAAATTPPSHHPHPATRSLPHGAGHAAGRRACAAWHRPRRPLAAAAGALPGASVGWAGQRRVF